MVGAPTTTPSAYAEIACPAAGIETSTPRASCGSRPIETNSVVPIANPPVASASNAMVAWRVEKAHGGARESWRSLRRQQPPQASHSVCSCDLTWQKE